MGDGYGLTDIALLQGKSAGVAVSATMRRCPNNSYFHLKNKRKNRSSQFSAGLLGTKIETKEVNPYAFQFD